MRPLRWLLVVVLAPLAGCLFSSTRVFEFDVIGNANLAAPWHVQDTQVGEAGVELIRARTYEESQARIEVVDRAGFAATVQNPGGTQASLSLYLSDVPGLTDHAASATHLLTLDVPPSGLSLSFQESEDLIDDLPRLRDAIEAGTFHLYAVAGAGVSLDVERLTLVVSMTVEQ